MMKSISKLIHQGLEGRASYPFTFLPTSGPFAQGDKTIQNKGPLGYSLQCKSESPRCPSIRPIATPKGTPNTVKGGAKTVAQSV